jgi:hypothetical protein
MRVNELQHVNPTERVTYKKSTAAEWWYDDPKAAVRIRVTVSRLEEKEPIRRRCARPDRPALR